MPTQQERRDAARAAILDAARRQFGVEGYAATSVQAVADDAGVSKGGLLHHFATKADLFRAVLDEVEVELTAAVAERALAAPTPRAQLRAGCHAMLDLLEDRAVHRIVFVDGPAVLGHEAWRAVEAEHNLGLILATLEAAHAAGELAQPPTETLGRVVLAGANEIAAAAVGADGVAAARGELDRFLDAIFAT